MKLSAGRMVSLFLVAAIVVLILFLPLPLRTPPPTDRHIRIEAGMYQYSPAHIAVNPGDRLTLELVSNDVVHGFSLDGYGIQIQSDPGQTATASFIADKPGAFRFRCSAPCGNLHPFMIGILRVGPNLFLLRGVALGLLGIVAGLVLIPKRSVQDAGAETAPGADTRGSSVGVA